MDQFNRLKSALVLKIQALRNTPRSSQSQIGVEHDNQSVPVAENVFAEFRQVTVMLSLLAAINSDGRQVLDSKPYEADQNFDAMPASLDRTQPASQLVMTALAVLLVRNNEVVAVTAAANGPDLRGATRSGIDSDHLRLPNTSHLHALASQEASAPVSDLAAPGLVDFIAVRNPEWYNKSNNSPSAKIWKENPSAQYMVLPKGTSRWEFIVKDAWSQKHKTVRYEDHAATVQDYLTYYQAIERGVMQSEGVDGLTLELKTIMAEKQIDAFDSFTHYILSTCSPKMHAQDKHSLSQRYFRCLCLITEDKLKSALLANKVAVNEPTRTRDIPLCDALLASDGVFDLLTNYMRTQFPDLPSEFNFGTLRGAFEQLRRFDSSGVVDMSKCPSIYTKDSAVEFHYLLLTVLASYKAGLEMLGTQCDVTGPEDQPPYQPEDYDLTWMFTFLLWRIAHSSVLRFHLTFLHATKLLSLDDACLEDCFGLGTGNVGAGTADEEPGITDQEMSVIQLHATSTSKHQQPEGLAFLRWFHLLVSDLTALENLSLFFSHGASSRMKVHVHAIALPPTSTDRVLWQPVIERALHSQAPLLYCHYDEIITTLVDRIKTGKEHTRDFTFYRHFTEQGMAVLGSVHCEAALACLVKHRTTALPVHGMEVQHDAASTGRLEDLAISTLCCPVCWHLLALMDPPIGRFGVRGHHLKMIPVQLPPWIPVTDAQAMLDAFQQKLCDELSIMLEKSSHGCRAGEIPSSPTQIIGRAASQSTAAGEEGPRLGFLSSNFKRLLKFLPSKFKLPIWKD